MTPDIIIIILAPDDPGLVMWRQGGVNSSSVKGAGVKQSTQQGAGLKQTNTTRPQTGRRDVFFILFFILAWVILYDGLDAGALFISIYTAPHEDRGHRIDIK